MLISKNGFNHKEYIVARTLKKINSFPRLYISDETQASVYMAVSDSAPIPNNESIIGCSITCQVELLVVSY